MHVRVDGQLISNNAQMIVLAALDGLSLACALEDPVAEQLDSGSLVGALADWYLPFAGDHLYDPSRRQPSAAFDLLVKALRYHAVR